MKCAKDDGCPYLGKDFACPSRAELQEELQNLLAAFLEAEEALGTSITFQNYIGKKYCFGDYSKCIYYQTRSRKEGGASREE
ncbi:MAG: hypothetical protein ACP5E4_04730 [Candidatus Aenigmatarchaeota archaeon]